MQAINPIETVYDGYRFRSRLEARWAVFFNALGIKYEYEKEGYDLGEAGWYLPDFWLSYPDLDWIDIHQWVEIKPLDFPTQLDECEKKCLALSSVNWEVILAQGNPWPGEYRISWFSHGQRTHVNHWLGFPGLDGEKRLPLFPVPQGQAWDVTYPWFQVAYLAARQARFEHGESPRL